MCLLLYIFFQFSGEDLKLLRDAGGPRQHVMSWKYFSGDITSRVIHLYKYPDVRIKAI